MGRKFKNFYEVGRNGTIEDFRAANGQALGKIRDRGTSYASYQGAEDQRELRKGALDAFFANRPEKLYMILKDPEQFRIRDGYINVDRSYPEKARDNVLDAIIKTSSGLAADIQRLVWSFPQEDEKTKREVLAYAMEKISRRHDRAEIKALARFDLEALPREGKRKTVQKILVHALDHLAPVSGTDHAVIHQLVSQAADYDKKAEKPVQDILSDALYFAATRPVMETAVWDTVKLAVQEQVEIPEIQEALNCALFTVIANHGTEAAAAALLNARADANAALDNDGYKGRLLAEAVRQEMPPAVIELLHEKGADFAAALYLMKTKPDEKWTPAEVSSLRTHAKRITGAPIPGDNEQEEMDNLRAELERTKQELTEKTGKLDEAEKKLDAANDEISRLNIKVRRYKAASTCG